MKQWTAMTLLLILLMSGTSVSESSYIEQEINDHTIRVLLSNLNITTMLNVTFTTDYLGVDDIGAQILIPAGSNCIFRIKDQQITLHIDSVDLILGNSITLYRKNGGSYDVGFVPSTLPNIYAGDLMLSIRNGHIQPILIIDVEYYLMGVLPYEMSSIFPLEALKAQAVAARTYAIRKRSMEGNYDITDNASSQVYYGYVSDYPECDQAVIETCGVCGMYNGKIAQCYYCASNGGQTEAVNSIWTTDEDFSYYATIADPYDYENPKSPVLSYQLRKEYTKTAPYALRQMLSKAGGESLGAEADELNILNITDCYVDTPLREGSSIMTRLHITARVEVKSAEDESLVQREELLKVEIPIFHTAESLLDLNINKSYDNEIWSVSETDSAFEIDVRRYGHGAGMSQRGAQWMAYKYGKTYDEILSFYYPGMTLITFKYGTSNSAGTLNNSLLKNYWVAVVSDIEEGTMLNMREKPYKGAKVIKMLEKNRQVLVLGNAEEKTWLRIDCDGTVGYVKKDFLKIYGEIK